MWLVNLVDHPTDQFNFSKGPSSTFRFLVLAYPTQHDKLCDDRPAVISLLCNQALKQQGLQNQEKIDGFHQKCKKNWTTTPTWPNVWCRAPFFASLFRPTLPSFLVWRSPPLRCCHVSAHRWRVERVRRCSKSRLERGFPLDQRGQHWMYLLLGGWTTHLKKVLVKMDHFPK